MENEISKKICNRCLNLFKYPYLYNSYWAKRLKDPGSVGPSCYMEWLVWFRCSSPFQLWADIDIVTATNSLFHVLLLVARTQRMISYLNLIHPWYQKGYQIRERGSKRKVTSSMVLKMIHNEEQHGSCIKKKKTEYKANIWSSNPTPGRIFGEKHNSKGYMHPNVHWSSVYNSQDTEATYLSIDSWMDEEVVVLT